MAAKHVVDARLPAGTAALEMINHVGIQANGRGNLLRRFLWTAGAAVLFEYFRFGGALGDEVSNLLLSKISNCYYINNNSSIKMLLHFDVSMSGDAPLFKIAGHAGSARLEV